MRISKFIGASLILACGWVLGNMMCKQEKKRCGSVGNLAGLMRCIRSQIDIYLLPIGNIVLKCDDIACSCGIVGFDSERGCIVWKDTASVDDVALRAINEYFDLAGRGDRSAEIKLCDHYISLLDQRYRILSQECDRRCRLIMTLCMCTAAGVALLLL